MKPAGLLLIIIIGSLTRCGDCYYESVKDAVSSLASSTFSVYRSYKCAYSECCEPQHVRLDIDILNDMLAKHVYGQHIAHQIVVSALRGHINSADPVKALAMSFHGVAGTGKNFVVQMIAKSFYKKGINSQYFHFFNGRNDFPLEREIENYKDQLLKTIFDSLTKCERSMFVFDEVDKMPEGLLNVLVPLLDYSSWHASARYTNGNLVYKNKAIYIFLSNTGSTQIVARLIKLWQLGKKRDDTKIQDFEKLITDGAFREKGGFHLSDTIANNVIDHYVPFLPLEEIHVKKCIETAFLNRGISPTSTMVEQGMSHVTFGPDPYNLYSQSGCKRIDQKVATIVYSKKKVTVENAEL